MKIQLYFNFFACLVLLLADCPAQTVTQEQCQQADVQLNQVYQQLRVTLNDVQKQQLKQAQREWIKKRDAFVAANPGNPQGALYQATMQRVRELAGFTSNALQAPQANSSIVTTAQQSKQQSVTEEQCQKADAQLNQVYQQVLSAMNDSQREQLKQEQRAWIKKRDAFVAANPGNTQAALLQATQERVIKLQTIIVCDADPNEVEAKVREKGRELSLLLNPSEMPIFLKDLEEEIQKVKESPNVGWNGGSTENHVRYTGLSDKLREIMLATNREIEDYKSKKKAVNALSKLEFIDKNKISATVTTLNNLLYQSVRFAPGCWENLIQNEDLINDYNYYSQQLNSIDQIWSGLKCKTITNENTFDITSSNPNKQERHVSSECSIINVTKPWTNENCGDQIFSHKAPLSVSVQDNPSAEVVSVAEALSYIAKSFQNNPKVYLYDKKSGIQLYSFNPTSVTGSVRDRDMTPTHLAFSKDERFLICSTGFLGYNGSNLSACYILNLNNLQLQYAQNIIPIIVKETNGNTYFPYYNFLSNSNNISDDFFRKKVNCEDRLIQWENEIRRIGNSYFNYESPEKIARRFAAEDFQEKDKHVEISEVDGVWGNLLPDAFIIANTNSINSFSVVWPEILGSGSSFVFNLPSGRLKLDSNVDVIPATIQKKITNPTTISDWDNNTDYWGKLFGVISTNNKICNGYGNIKTSYVSTDCDLKILAIDLDHQGKQGRTFSVSKLSSGAMIAMPNNPNPLEQWQFPENLSSSNGFATNIPIMMPQKMKAYDQDRFHYLDLLNKSLWFSSDKYGLFHIDIKSDKIISQYTNIPAFQFFAIVDQYVVGVKDRTVPRIDIWNIKSQKKIIDLYPNTNGSYYCVTPDNVYLGVSKGRPNAAFKIGMKGYPFEQFDLRLNRPDIVLERLGAPKEAIEAAKSLRDKRLKRMGVSEEMLKPDFHLPELQIVGEVPATTPKDQLDLQIKATDDKYPLDRLRVYVNNVPVNGRDGELLRDQKTQSLEKTIPIKLTSGRNKIQVSVLNSAGAESLYANAEVNCTTERPKPKLYAVALGVSQYDRPEWCLKYAAKDATDLIEKLKEKAGSSYCEVKPLLLIDKEVTKESAAKIKEFLSGATIDDTVLIFMAGHGLLDDKYDYYFGTSDIDPARPSERGMPYEAIDNILAEVPSLKKALLMDTCHAGELDEDEKKELAASDGTATPSVSPDTSSNSTNSSPLAGKVAMRAIGTRGMQVKAVEGAKGKSDWYEKLQDMFVDLRRGSGATVISSSQGAEYAFESSEQSNGLFTYALMEALDGKATPNKDGQITISTIGDYVKKRVQDLTKGKQNPNLRGVNLEEDFVLGAAK